MPYLLPKYVFVRRGYAGWAELGAGALHMKCRPYVAELRENWQRLKVSHTRAGTGNGRELKRSDGATACCTARRIAAWRSCCG